MSFLKLSLPLLLFVAMLSTARADNVREIAPGVWRVAGDNAATSLTNLGAIANTGIIATGDGVIVIDPGPTLQYGRRIAALVKSLTTEPVRWVIDTHPHPENVLGNNAFPEATVMASAAAAKLMQSRCQTCLQHLTEQLGSAAMAGTEIRVPTRMVDDGEIMVLGRLQLQFLVFAHAHTRGDLAIFLPETGVLFAGGLINDVRVPDLREAVLSGWITALAKLQSLPVRSVVPGHGAATAAALPSQFAAYLTDLRAACDRDIAARGDAASSGARLGLPKYGQWFGYATQHRLNVANAYREREDAQFFGDE